MRAVLMATGFEEGLRPVVARVPTPLFEVGGKPMLHHALEVAAAHGCEKVDVLVAHLPEKVRESAGDGTRWGIDVEWHAVSNESAAWRHVKAMISDGLGSQVLIGRADVIPLEGLPHTLVDSCFVLDAAGSWTGWGVVPTEALSALGEDRTPDDQLREAVELVDGAFEVATRVIDVRTWSGLLEANKLVVQGKAEELLLNAREVEPGIWLSRNVMLHPRARVQAPVLVGENTRVGAGAVIGPGAILGADCIVADGARVAESVVTSRTYVGESLDVEECIVEPACLVNVALDAAVPVTDQFLVGDLSRGAMRRWLGHTMERALGVVALLPATPLLLAGWVLALAAGRHGLHRAACVRLPAGADPRHWKNFEVLSFGARSIEAGSRGLADRLLISLRLDGLPGVFNIIGGTMRFAGQPPRSREEIEEMNDVWRGVYLVGRTGFANLTDVQHGSDANDDERYACESFQTVTSSPMRDLKLFMRWAFGPRGQGGRRG